MGSLLLATWVVSLAQPLDIHWPGDAFALGSGCVGYPERETSDPEVMTVKVHQVVWVPKHFPMPPVAFIPLWIPLLVVSIPICTLWYRDRRAPQGRCRKCGYDLTGNVSGVCPECGMPSVTDGHAS